MWYTIDDGNGGKKSYGYSPKQDGAPRGPGKVGNNDDTLYQSKVFSRNIEISQEQYDKLKQFGDSKAVNPGIYNGLSNSCIDFTWKALEEAGLNPSGFEGDILPSSNIDDVERINTPALGKDLTPLSDSDLRDIADYVGDRMGLPPRALRDWIDNSGDRFAEALRDQLRRLIDPIVLDLDGNGIELTPRASSNVFFDMDGDGIKEQTGWVKPTDGLLAIDNNANGQIDNINELIGDLGRSGFAELLTYDLNNDRILNANDSVWSQFRVWLDANSNGATDAGELRTLASLNIRSIDLKYTAVNFTAEGNRIHEQSIFEYTNGSTGLIADIWFDVSNVTSNSSVGLTGNITIDNLPDIRGQGDVRSLRSVMLADGALATLVAGFVSQNLANLANARNQTEQILYRWAGVQTVDPSSRGGLFDGRKLAALEAFLGTEFSVQGIRNPNAQAVGSLTASWNGLVDGILARLLMSGPLGNAMADSAVYMPEIDRLLTLLTPPELLTEFKIKAPAGDSIAIAGYWAAVLPLAREITQDVGGDPESAAFIAAVSGVLQNIGLAPFADLLAEGIIPWNTANNVLESQGVFRLTSGNDTVWLGADRHVVFAGGGNDIVSSSSDSSQSQHLDGGVGNDQLFGTAGDDWLDGGAGADTLIGGVGDDTYTVDDAGDVVIEGASGGEDQVRSSVSYVLGADLEHLTLLGTVAINGAGNAVGNRLFGNTAANRLEGLAGDDTLNGGAGNDTLVGGSGADLYIVDAAGDVIIETGNEIDTVESSVNYTLGLRLENLVLTGAAVLGTGNGLNNRLTGNALANTLNGGAGADVMSGGLGGDTYVVDNSGDIVQEEVGAGTDLVQSSISYSLSAEVENLQLTGGQDINGTGNELANRITGNGGDNWIDGGTAADTMAGGAGDDTYIVDNAGDVVTEAANAGTDQVQTTLAAYTLSANVERLQLFIGFDDGVNRNGTGNELDNEIVGTSGINRLSGLGGNDALYGGAGNDSLLGGDGDDLLDGGSERDRMEGGTGNDLYIVDLATDIVLEAVNAGTDTVQSSVSWILGANVENLTLTGGDAIDGQGNALNNVLIGNTANNGLDGGAGADTLIGGVGDDTYTVDDAGDVVIELPGSGMDSVRSSVSFTLSSAIENLVLLGSGDINGIGNIGSNNIDGNSGSNLIDGGGGGDTMTAGEGNDTLIGGGGSDTLIGGAGNDSYLFDADVALGTDTLNETGGGTDTLNFSATTTLAIALNLGLATTQVVNTNLSLNLGSASTFENVIGGGLADRLTGNSLNNSLTGGGGNDTLIGGAGNDTLVGGLGADRFRFATAPNATTNRDVISDFSIAQGDRIELENAIFTGLPTTGPLAASSFLIGTAATNGSQRILYNSATGLLSYDSDGNGAVAAIAFATITPGLPLNSTYFTVT